MSIHWKYKLLIDIIRYRYIVWYSGDTTFADHSDKILKFRFCAFYITCIPSTETAVVCQEIVLASNDQILMIKTCKKYMTVFLIPHNSIRAIQLH